MRDLRIYAGALANDFQTGGSAAAGQPASCQKAVDRPGTRRSRDQSEQPCQIEQVCFEARRSELRPSRSHFQQLYRGEAVGQCTVTIATMRMTAIGRLAILTKAPSRTAIPPSTSTRIVSHANR